MSETTPPQPPRDGTPSPESLGLGEVGPIPPALLIAIARREQLLKQTIKAQVDKGMAEINDQMDTVRVSMKYLAFDNECLKREAAERDKKIKELEQRAGLTVVFNLAQKLSTIHKMRKDSSAYWDSVKASMESPLLGIACLIVQKRCFTEADTTDCMLVVVRPGYRWKTGVRPMSAQQLHNEANWEKINAQG